eukprot:TRINITY_DN6194_c0_g1_i1.p2 TRINITY_DN6194_c0_g1~~TRINITY_DN6194_c0_g1_i1.p2  ORF type:complete len:124 (+),score=46.24 TRINITY_DN6194_c0_g1_i1:108-479(+)
MIRIVGRSNLRNQARAATRMLSTAKPMTEIPDLEKQVEGVEKMEVEAIKAGRSVFPSNEGVLTGPFGTESAPVKVPSAFSSRIVGCTGGAGDASHDLLWHEVREGENVVCVACGQFFQLEKVE